MANIGEYNNNIDKQTVYTFSGSWYDDNDVPIDVSDWTFQFYLKNNLGDIIWNIPNVDISRPNIYTISFSKSVAELQLVEDGNYIPSLLVTKPNNEWVDNDILTGTWAFK
jgi:hypothetical protein